MIKKSYLFALIAVTILAIVAAFITKSLLIVVVMCSIYVSASGATIIYLYYKRKRQKLLEFQRDIKEKELYSKVCPRFK